MADPRIELALLDEPPVLTSDGSEWYRVLRDGVETEVLIHFGQDEHHRWIVDNLLIRDGRIRADDLRAVPVGLVERLMNSRIITLGAAGSIVLGPPPPLERMADDNELDFALRVARQYRYFSAVSRSPAKQMAEEAGVPLSTIRWWLREARRLQALPPGRKGSVG